MRIFTKFCNPCPRKLDNQWLATIGALMLVLQIGVALGWASPNIAYLSGPPISLTKDQISWLASLLSLGAVAGSIVGLVVNMLIGSRKTILLTLLVLSVSWILIIVDDSVDYLYASRLLAGIGKGSTNACYSLYLAEIASPAKRGTFISIASIGLPAGSLFGLTAETYVSSMKVSSSIYLCLCLISVTLLMYLRDPPYYLAKSSDSDELTKRSIAFYQSDGDDVERKFDDVKSYIAKNAKNSLKSRLGEFATPSVRRSLVLIVVLYALEHLSGLSVISNYLQVILIKSKSNIVKPELLAIISEILELVTAFLARNAIDKLGRKLLLVISSVAVSLEMVALGVHFTLLNLGVDLAYIEWIPLVAVLIKSVIHSVGFTPVFHTVMSEMFSESTKSVAACVGALTNSLMIFTVNKTYQPLVDAYGESCPFWIYAGFALLYLPCVMFLMIETKGKTLQEIQDELKGREREKCVADGV